MVLPARIHLPHELPHWVRDDAILFITVCCLPRGWNHLARDDIAARIFESVEFRQSRGDWHVFVCLLMLDHLHMLASISPEVALQRTISNWKENLAKRARIPWQRDFFDHRLRADESFSEKYTYIMNNPVRKGYVASPEQWRYVWHPKS